MNRLRTGYFISGCVIGLILLVSFLTTLPDGKLHMVFCDVGQGDSIYVRFPDGRDMLVDGGPNNAVLECLGRAMPFWDRSIDMVVLTHPQKDHLQGLIEVVKRYHVSYFVKSEVDNSSLGYKDLRLALQARNVPIKYVTSGDQIRVGATLLQVMSPMATLIAQGKSSSNVLAASTTDFAAPSGDLNDYSVILLVRYGSFDALLTGDADTRVEKNYIWSQLPDEHVEVLKVPHHGSKTGMTAQYLSWLHPQYAVISVGAKNTYGHPGQNILDFLNAANVQTFRTDQDGDVTIVTDGHTIVPPKHGKPEGKKQ